MPTGTLAVLAQRLGRVFAAPSTWQRLVRRFGWRRPRLRVHPQVNPLTRRGTVEIVLDPVPPGARAGQLARVTLTIDAVAVLAVPLAAVQRDRDGEYAFVLNADGTVSRVPVRAGTRLGTRVEILEGLAEEQRVVVKGFLGLKHGMAVESVRGSGSADGG